MNKAKLDKMEAARYLLEPPGGEVVGELLEEIRQYRAAQAKTVKLLRTLADFAERSPLERALVYAQAARDEADKLELRLE